MPTLPLLRCSAGTCAPAARLVGRLCGNALRCTRWHPRASSDSGCHSGRSSPGRFSPCGRWRPHSLDNLVLAVRLASSGFSPVSEPFASPGEPGCRAASASGRRCVARTPPLRRCPAATCCGPRSAPGTTRGLHTGRGRCGRPDAASGRRGAGHRRRWSASADAGHRSGSACCRATTGRRSQHKVR